MRINKSLITYIPASGGGSGSVTSVALTAPTGFAVSGSPIVSSGTLALTFASGYSLPTTVKQSTWDDAYTWVTNFPVGTEGQLVKFDAFGDLEAFTPNFITNPMTSLGDMIYGNAVGFPLRLAPNTTTTKKYLSMTGDGTNGDAPTWEAISGFIDGVGTTNKIPKFTASGTIGNSTIGEVTGSIIFGPTAGATGTLQLTTASPSSPVSGRLMFGTDGTGWQYRIAKNQAGTITDLFTIADSGNVGINQLTPSEKLDVVGNLKLSGNLVVDTNTLYVDSASNRVGVLNAAPSYAFDLTGQARITEALAIGTTPDTNTPFKILKNLNSTVGIRFENTSTSSLAFSAIQFGTDVAGGTAFCNLVYASSGITENGVFKPNGTALLSTGNGGLNFGAVSQPIRFFTGSGTGTRRAEITNDGDLTHFNATIPTSSTTDAFRMYSADITAGNAAPHFRTENGAVIKLYQETTSVGNAIISLGGGSAVLDDTTFDGYTLRQIVKALRNQGILQ
jgi:hypothetical protein